MSNTVVGTLYQQVIDEVITSSRVDFEEGGVDESVLEELRQGWQNKLSQFKIATFPWDPKPEAAAASVAAAQPAKTSPPTASALSGQAQPQQLSPHVPAHGLPLPTTPTSNGAQQRGSAELVTKVDPEIKQEPGLQNGPMPPPYQAQDSRNVAAFRASQALHNQYGNRAANSISAIHAGMAGQEITRTAVPVPKQPNQPMNAQLYRQQIAQSTQAQQQRAQKGQPGVNAAQTDGAGDEDFEAVLVQQNQDGSWKEMGRMDIDRLLHAQIAARAKSMEGGGLMLPLKEATKHRTAKTKSKEPVLGQLDGGDDGTPDEDAINSDLDDPDEGLEGSNDDDSPQHMMLCMYEKVQRVKNKWKCVLKEGILTVNGRDYIFARATAEFEW